MAIITIRKAIRGGSRLVIGVAGVSGSGKTVTAIHLAYGLANYDASKVGFLDTENRRGSLNADVLKNATVPTDEPFLIADLHAPFSPQRCADAIQEFQKAGIEVLIFDSTSHEWEGIGGCQEIADSCNGMWNKAKKLHKSPFMSALLQSDMHIIACVRAREKDKPEKVNGKTEYISYGLQPIQEKNFMFEMTASLMMHDEGMRQTPLKIPGDLRKVLGRGEGYITAEDGKAIRDWVDGAERLDPAVEKFRNRLLSNTEPGVAHITACWSKTPKEIQDALGAAFLETITKSAEAFDKMRAEATANESSSPPSGGVIDTAASDIAATAAAGVAERAKTVVITPVAETPTAPALEEKPVAPVVQQQPAAKPAPATAAAPVRHSTPTTPATRTPQPGVVAAKTPTAAKPAAAPVKAAPSREPMF